MIGILSIQGGCSEHISSARAALAKLGKNDAVRQVRYYDDVSSMSARDYLIIPGGESTTIGKLMKFEKIFDEICELAHGGMPVMGTCAGAILLAKKGDVQVKKTGQPLLGLMDIKVKRNAFGRQRESFEAKINLPEIGINNYPGVFIRAPRILSLGQGVEILAEFRGDIVAAKQGNIIALSFHPELTDDTRIHEFFLNLNKS